MFWGVKFSIFVDLISDNSDEGLMGVGGLQGRIPSENKNYIIKMGWRGRGLPYKK